ncbi:serine kinase [Mesorhizobium sp. B2-5-9]|uniref:serine kinase n=1 Tax=Mesorhizobium sp. B2-5-9 TaxID=2589921 RepID=UPI00112B8E6C|nr:serine kinase [Mesorhizobium sp. B2-5-9]TPK21372.1 serine kinase [Mesorhizobium sp. B2-5-9]
MPRVTLETLPDYARYLIAAAEGAAACYPTMRKVRLPWLELTVHLGHGVLADALGHAFVEPGHDQPAPSTGRIFIAHPGIDGIPEPAHWGDAHFTEHGFAKRLAEAGLRGHHFHDLDFWQVYDPHRRVGVQLMASADAFPPWEPGAPLRAFLHWEYAARGMRLTHAGTLGIDGNGILLAGSGGAGKSGTVAAGLLNGLDSVGDDYVLIDLTDGVTARPLFSTLKQDTEGFARLGLRQRLTAQGPLNWQGKHTFHIHDIAPRPVPAMLDIVALVAPHISGGGASSIMPVSRRDAMIALAPSGIAQMPGERESGFRFFSELTRHLPCFRLSLGIDPAEIARTIEDFLTRGAR